MQKCMERLRISVRIECLQGIVDNLVHREFLHFFAAFWLLISREIS
jgi:hypothetical protein